MQQLVTCHVSDLAHVATENAVLSYRVALFISGFWWFIFSIPTWFCLRPRASQSLPEGQNYITVNLVELWVVLKSIKKLPETAKYITALWLFMDGFMTAIYGAGLLASQDLHFDGLKLGLVLLMSNLVSVVGNLFYYLLFTKFPRVCSAKNM